jgi:hypothetical protein
MTHYRFTVYVPTPIATHNEILNIMDTLRDAGCTDASIRGHKEGFELLFNRPAESKQAAISSAVLQVHRAGYDVSMIELDGETIQTGSRTEI